MYITHYTWVNRKDGFIFYPRSHHLLLPLNSLSDPVDANYEQKRLTTKKRRYLQGKDDNYEKPGSRRKLLKRSRINREYQEDFRSIEKTTKTSDQYLSQKRIETDETHLDRKRRSRQTKHI